MQAVEITTLSALSVLSASTEPPMPATFESFGLRFLYPDNWVVVDRAEDERGTGVTLELPSGGFVTVEVADEDLTDDQLVDEIEETIREEYETVERTEMPSSSSLDFPERIVDFEFYYLDLLIQSRLILMATDEHRLLIQLQAESRDFDANRDVFEAVLAQIRQC